MTPRLAFSARLVAAAAVMFAAAACSSGGGSETVSPEAVRLDLQKGTIDAVRLGNSAADLRAAFGPGEVTDPVDPSFSDPEAEPDTGDGGYGPQGITFGGPGATVMFHDYSGKSFTLVNDRLVVIEVTQPGAVTEEGVAIGDSLDDVRDAYPDMKCFTAFEDTEYPEYPACLGRAGSHVNVWFGGDPIRNITLATAPID